jgi:folate-binding protein YgfZ
MVIDALRAIQKDEGAILDESGIPLRFQTRELEIQAARQMAALYDRSHWGRLQISGNDRLRFLHNQSTNTFQTLKPGQGCETVFVTSTARTLDLATAYISETAVLVLVSPNRRQKLLDWLDRYIFPFDQVTLQDLSAETATLSLIGPQSKAALQQLGLEIPPDLPHHHQLQVLDDRQVLIATGSGLGLPGYTLISAVEDAAFWWQQFTQVGVTPIGTETWETLRIQQGCPAPDRELTEDYNPLEAGLWHTLSFDKGCYIGQETIARLNTYKGVKQRLWGLQLEAWVDLDTKIEGQALETDRKSSEPMTSDRPSAIVTAQGEKVGKLTSLTNTPEGIVGLAYIRTKAGGPGLAVQVGDVKGTVMAVPFLAHPEESS